MFNNIMENVFAPHIYKLAQIRETQRFKIIQIFLPSYQSFANFV